MTDLLPRNAVGRVPVTFADALGNPVPAPASISFTLSNPAVASVVFADGVLTITPIADGSVTITADGLEGSLELTIAEPVAAKVTFGEIAITPAA